MNFQVTVLKILVSYPGGLAPLAELKRDMAILATSGRDWTDYTKRLAARVPDLDVFSQGLVERRSGGWRITDKGRMILELMQARPAEPDLPVDELPSEPPRPAERLPRLPADALRPRRARPRRRRAARARTQSMAS